MQDHWQHFASFIHNCTHRRAVELAQSEECFQKPCLEEVVPTGSMYKFDLTN